MIRREYAEQIAQNVNCERWINYAIEEISRMIENTAKEGRRCVSINPAVLITGSENLLEAANMLTVIDKILKEEKYNFKILTNGVLVIAW